MRTVVEAPPLAYDVIDLSMDGESSALPVKPRWRFREGVFMTDSQRLERRRGMLTMHP
jgi:hypothetical protein